MIRTACLILSLSLFASGGAAEPRANQLFGAKQTASRGAPEAIGGYSRGCAAGLVQLPETGPSWQAMRLSRNRNWGHPDLLQFIERLGRTAQAQGWAGIYVGDLSQPRGGPMLTGHQSHQTGIDGDFWMLPPKRLDLTRRERENISSISVRSRDETRVNGNWTRAHHEVLKAAASDPSVDRIFVTPPVKIAMCQGAKRSDRKWLQKIRPYWGHHYHFHVRLKCPKGSRECEPQKPTVAKLSKGGSGCDETLNWWVTTRLEELRNPPPPPKNPPPRKRGARELTMADLPRQCAQVLSSN